MPKRTSIFGAVTRALLASLCLAALSVTSPAPAAAQDDRAQARERFSAGVARYEAGDYQGALENFQEAYRLAPHPNVRVNMANSYERLGRPLEALHHFERFLAEADGAPRAQRREIEAAMQRLSGEIGELRLSIAPDGATVEIDGSETRRAPIVEPIRLTAGTHHIEVRLEGYRTMRREVQIRGGQPSTLEVRLERASASVAAAEPAVREPEPAAGEPEPAAREPEPEPVAETEPSSEPPEEDEARFFHEPPPGGEVHMTTPVWIAAIATAAFGIGAIVAGAIALDADASFENAVLRSNDPGLSQPERDQARADGLSAADTANAASIATDVMLVGTLLAAGATVFFLIISADEAPDSQQAGSIRIAPSASPDGGALVVSGRF